MRLRTMHKRRKRIDRQNQQALKLALKMLARKLAESVWRAWMEAEIERVERERTQRILRDWVK